MADEKSFRPMTFDDYQGQDKAKRALKIYIASAKARNDTLDHVLVYGSSGLGKTSLANVIANEMGGSFKVYMAPSIKKVDDVNDILMNVQEGDILFLDEIHRLNSKCEEQMFAAMEQFVLEAVIDDMPQKIDLPHFTIIGATTSAGMLSEPFRNRFGITIELESYSDDTMSKLVKRSFEGLKMECPDECAQSIALRSRGVPRIANGFVRRVRDFAYALSDGQVTLDTVDATFEVLEIDPLGLTRQDRKYMRTLLNYRGKAVGLDLLAAAMDDDKTTLESAVEPYLIRKGYVMRTPKGRMLTETGTNIAREF